MEREVVDRDGIRWTCVQAYTGLNTGELHQEAAQVDSQEDAYWVVCTPSGNAQTVRVKLPDNWQDSYSDEMLLNEIQAHR